MMIQDATNKADDLRRKIILLIHEYEQETGTTVEIIKCHSTPVEKVKLSIQVETGGTQ